MKRGFLILISICYFLPARARQDSIQVVIDCDSLYRPFLDEFGEASYGDFHLKLNEIKEFKIQRPFGQLRKSLLIRLDNTFDNYLDNVHLSVGENSYGDEAYNSNTGDLILSNKVFFNKVAIIKVNLPTDCKYNAALLNNNCVICNQNDSVSWIHYGPMIEHENSRELLFPKVYNPYLNPIFSFINDNRLVSYNGPAGGYNLGGCYPHWFCHRCKKEY